MMVKEASSPMPETILRRESSADGIKAKSSLHSLHTSESTGNFTKNGNKFNIGRASATVTPTGHPPSGRYRRNARATSAERPRCTSGSPYNRRKVMARRQSVYKPENEQDGLTKSTSFTNSSPASSRDSSIVSPNSGSTHIFQASNHSTQQFKGIYDKLLWQHQYDEASQRDVTLGRRIGFYKFKSEIGSGNFSKVKLAIHQITKERVAVKIINKTRLDMKTQKMLQREMKIMDLLSHPNLIRLYEVNETVTSIYLVMEMAPLGELFAKLSEEGGYSENQAKGIFAQVASAVQYMHEHFFIHRDLKAENVFFADQRLSFGNGPNKVTYPMVKVGDFGFATKVSSLDQHLTTFCGSPPYASPELFKDDHYVGPAVDIWALGILLVFLVTGGMPFRGSTVAALKHSILEGKFDLPATLSEPCMELIRGILRKRPEWRLNMKQIRESRWLLGVFWPSPDSKYRPLPVERNDNSTIISAEELKVRSELESLGIDGTLLESQIEYGNTSAVIGTFRIIMHRIVNGSERKVSQEWSDLECQSFNSRGGSSKGSRSKSSDHQNNDLHSATNKNRELQNNSKKTKGQSSKFCTLL